MANTSKLEFYRFELNPKHKSFKTFKDFVTDELVRKKSMTDAEAVENCFKHFIKALGTDIASDDILNKELTLIEKKSVNKYLAHKPTFDSSKCIISGVINGGPYGRDKIISDKDDRDNSSALSRKNSVLQYFYFFLYVPTDHNEGCFIIHSNSSDESITILFRNFISKFFKGSNYNKAISKPFCPISFQEEFKKGAVLKNMIFKSSFIDNIPNTNGIDHILNAYDIKIEATPKNKDISVTEADSVRKKLSNLLFGSKNKEKRLGDFEETKLVTKNSVTNTQKVFEWDTKDKEFVPVVYLNGRINKYNADNTPDFTELAKLCSNLFNDEILLEIRPDKNATKIT